jgi:hypothetical protein
VSYILTCIVAILLTFFLKFHIFLASTNKTTIENLDKKGKPYRSQYDMGSINNIYQIFGTNKWLWPFPVFCGSGKPLGDGIYWPSNIQSNGGLQDGGAAASQYSSNAAAHQSRQRDVQSPGQAGQPQQRTVDQSVTGVLNKSQFSH